MALIPVDLWSTKYQVLSLAGSDARGLKSNGKTLAARNVPWRGVWQRGRTHASDWAPGFWCYCLASCTVCAALPGPDSLLSAVQLTNLHNFSSHFSGPVTVYRSLHVPIVLAAVAAHQGRRQPWHRSVCASFSPLIDSAYTQWVTTRGTADDDKEYTASEWYVTDCA